MQSSEKKEKFEREARYKLEIEVKKLQKQNKQHLSNSEKETHSCIVYDDSIIIEC